MKKLFIFIVMGLFLTMPAFVVAGDELATLADLGTLEWDLSTAIPPDAETILQAKQIEVAKIHNQWFSGSTVQVFGGAIQP